MGECSPQRQFGTTTRLQGWVCEICPCKKEDSNKRGETKACVEILRADRCRQRVSRPTLFEGLMMFRFVPVNSKCRISIKSITKEQR